MAPNTADTLHNAGVALHVGRHVADALILLPVEQAGEHGPGGVERLGHAHFALGAFGRGKRGVVEGDRIGVGREHIVNPCE